MLHRLWQSGMIGLAQSEKIKNFMQKSRATSFLSDKYVAGNSPNKAITKANKFLQEENIRGSFFYLGEYVNSIDLVNINVKNKQAIVRLLKNENIDIHISVDPTQIGYTVSEEIGHKNALDIAKQILLASNNNKLNKNCLMLDMEDFSVVDKTISLHNEIKELGYPVAITLQAYLKRTETDIQKLIENGSMVRLVKGAFTARPEVSFTKQSDIKKNYYKLVKLMFSKSAKKTGFYPVIATHDEEVQQFATDEARKNEWEKGSYEFEMLLGVRFNLAQELVNRGERVRLYMPFGKDWWPYAIRRIGENPRNGLLLVRSLIN